MKKLRATGRIEAFTLIELLAVVVIIAVFALMVFPGRPNVKQRAISTMCANHQKQITVGFSVWASDNEQSISRMALSTNAIGTTTDVRALKFPWQISTNLNGTMELISDARVVSQFLVLRDILKEPEVFICPSDKVKLAASDVYEMGNSNISYFVNVDASPATNTTTTILSGDRHLQASGNPVKAGLFVYTNGMAMGWTRELHPTLESGNLSFPDGHVERVTMTSEGLTTVFKRQNVASTRLLVP